MSGYDLGQNIRGSVGFFWNESYGQIYPNLKKLAAEGLVGSLRRNDSGAGRTGTSTRSQQQGREQPGGLAGRRAAGGGSAQ